MSFRTVVIKNRSKLELKLGYLIVRSDTEKRVHLSEIDTLIVETTGTACTAALLCELVRRNINVIFCNEKHLPHFYLTPYAGNYSASKNIGKQCNWSEQRKAAAWTAIVKNKIHMQAALLDRLGYEAQAGLLCGYISELTEGDLTNREGHAAKVYFNALFGMDFSRRGDMPMNGPLDYGYSILLSATAREIAADGYITQLGIWHDSVLNNYNLASDIMEPFRPIVDAFSLLISSDDPLSQRMPAIMLTKVRILGELHYLESAIRLYVRSVLRFMDGKTNEIPFISEYTFQENEL